MKISKLRASMEEARKFLHCANELLNEQINNKLDFCVVGTKKSGATRRASMDLTRSLAELRKP